jgi:hypothetical protein
MRRRIVVIPTVLLSGALLVSCSSPDTGTVTDTGTAAAPGAEPGVEAEPGIEEETPATPAVYKFGQTVKFNDGNTLTVGKPVKFKRDEYASGGENQPIAVKFKLTFKNNSKTVFDPALTAGSVSAGGEEGESIYQTGLDAPENKVLPGKSVTWSMGYGVKSTSDLQLEVDMGFLEYGTVIFTN